jgi:proteic killer suppression protein
MEWWRSGGERTGARPFPQEDWALATIAPNRIETFDDINVKRYHHSVIKNFRSAETARLFAGNHVRRWMNIETVAMRKLAMLHRAGRLDDLRIPPANRLEALKGGRAGQHSIRINDQFRVCFRWHEGDAYDVEIVDYH